MKYLHEELTERPKTSALNNGSLQRFMGSNPVLPAIGWTGLPCPPPRKSPGNSPGNKKAILERSYSKWKRNLSPCCWPLCSVSVCLPLRLPLMSRRPSPHLPMCPRPTGPTRILPPWPPRRSSMASATASSTPTPPSSALSSPPW